MDSRRIDQTWLCYIGNGEFIGEINMADIKFLTGRNDKKYVCWCTVHTLKDFREFLQYILDNMVHPEEFLILNTENNYIYSAIDVARSYGMRKRTFEERMDNVLTGHFKEGE